MAGVPRDGRDEQSTQRDRAEEVTEMSDYTAVNGTRFTDDESGHLCYRPQYFNRKHGIWLFRDPQGERGGPNLYPLSGGLKG